MKHAWAQIANATKLGALVDHMDVATETLLDDIDNLVMVRCAAWPERRHQRSHHR